MPLLSFHNSQEIKDKYVNRLKHHQEQDNIIQGTGWENGKGCAVGCTLENYDHNQYPIEIGIPIWLSKVEDKIFEGLCNEDAKEFPIEFLQSIPIGVDLDKVKIPFLIIIVESVINTFDHKKFTNVLKSIEKVLKILKNNNSCFSDADAAYAAAAAADAAYAAYAAAAAYAAYVEDREKKLQEYLVIANSFFSTTNQTQPFIHLDQKIVYLIDDTEENLIIQQDNLFFMNMNGITRCHHLGCNSQDELIEKILNDNDAFYWFARRYLNRLYP